VGKRWSTLALFIMVAVVVELTPLEFGGVHMDNEKLSPCPFTIFISNSSAVSLVQVVRCLLSF
jgi:hypothetical protein